MARVLAHAHSTWSHDGLLTLEAWADIARARGLQAVLLTEHEETGWTPERYAAYRDDCQRLSDINHQLIPGIEFNQDGFHVLCYGLQQYPARPSSLRQLYADVHAQHCILCLAHPGKYRWDYPPRFVEMIDAIEVWNSKWIYDGRLGPHPRSLYIASGKQLVVGQDVHKTSHLTRLTIETTTPNVLEDISRGQYQIAWGKRRWTTQELMDRSWLGVVQQLRVVCMRLALPGIRFVRSRRSMLLRVLRRIGRRST